MKNDEHYWSIILKNIEWIKFSEAKAGIIITVYGLILSLIYTNAADTYRSFSESAFLIFLGIASIVLSGISTLFCFKSLNPVLKNENPTSVIYFGHISSRFKTHAEYFKESSRIFADEALRSEQLAEQAYITARIAWRKFKNVSWAIRFFVSSLFVALLSVTYYLF